MGLSLMTAAKTKGPAERALGAPVVPEENYEELRSRAAAFIKEQLPVLAKRSKSVRKR